MKYASEILALMPAYPDREWKMAELVRAVLRGRPADERERNKARQGVLRVMRTLVDAGQVDRIMHGPNVMSYRWQKVRHAVVVSVPKVRQELRQ